MENEVVMTVDNVMSNVASALADAVEEYGPQAVELGLAVYRIDAAQSLLNGFLMTLIAISAIIAACRLWKLFSWRHQNDSYGGHHKKGDLTEGAGTFRAFTLAIAGILCGIFGIPGLSSLSYIPAWMAVFGYPEVYMATKALVGAGLM